MFSVSFRRCQPSNLQSELGLNLLGAVSLLWNRSTLSWCVCFTFLCAEPLSQSCPRLLPQRDSFLGSRWEILSVSAAREATPKHSWKSKHNPGCGDDRNRSDAVRRLNPYLCGARHPFSPSFVAFWRHPKLSWGVFLTWEAFSNVAIPMFICTLVRTCFSWLRGAVTADGNQWKETALFQAWTQGLVIEWCRTKRWQKTQSNAATNCVWITTISQLHRSAGDTMQ